MDPALRKETEAFKKRAIAAVEKSQRPRELKEPKEPKEPFARPKQSNYLKSSTPSINASNPHRILKAITDKLKERYINKNYSRMSLEEILASVELNDLKPDMVHWIEEALANNPKVDFEERGYLFKPALGHGVCNRKQLLAKLRDNDQRGLGGILVSDIKESVHNSDKAVKRLIDDKLVICITKQDKDQVLFYNPDFSLREQEWEQFQSLWHRVSVEGMTEADIEKYLENVGLSAMQGESRKRKAPGNLQKKTRKKNKQAKLMNTHLDNELLIDYSDKK